MTPAIGQEPMKPLTIRRFSFMGAEREKTPNAEYRTPNFELKIATCLTLSSFGIRRSAFGVGRFPPLHSAQGCVSGEIAKNVFPDPASGRLRRVCKATG